MGRDALDVLLRQIDAIRFDIRDFTRSGVNLNDEQRQRLSQWITVLEMELAELESQIGIRKE
jgi:Zn-dependent oligopeptidase